MARAMLVALAFAALIQAPASALAGPITVNWIINQPDRVLVDFSHGSVIATHRDPVTGFLTFMSPAIVPPGGGVPVRFWEVNLAMIFTDAPLDVAGVVAFLEHRRGPHGEGRGPVFDFSLQITAAGPAGTVVTAQSVQPRQAHGAHFDELIRASFSGTVSPVGNFGGVDFNLAARHVARQVPEPGSLLLFGVAAFGLFAYRSRPIRLVRYVRF